MDVFENLVPRSWRGWVVALVALIISFWFYYAYAYENILSTYQQTFLSASIAADVVSVVNPQSTDLSHISITVSRPKSIAFADFVERECIVRIENSGQDEVEFLLTARGQPHGEDTSSPLRVRAEANFENEEYTSAFPIKIPGNSVQEIVLYISLEHVEEGKDNRNYKLSLYLNGSELKFSGEALVFPYRPLDAFRESLMKFFLFPPLSNVFLVSIVLFVVGGVENKKKSALFFFFSFRWFPFSVALSKPTQCDKKHFGLGQFLVQKIHPIKIAFSKPTQFIKQHFDWDKFFEDVREIFSWLICSGILFLSSVWFGWTIMLWNNRFTLIFSFFALVLVIGFLLLNVKEPSSNETVLTDESAVQ